MLLRENALFKTRLLSDKLDQVIRFGYVTARQPEKMRVRVELRDTPTSPMVTYWLPVLCPRACGDLVYDLPDIGDQVLCVFLPNGLESGFVLGAMYGKATPPVTSGDKYHRKFKDGTTIEYDRSEHVLTANVKGKADITTTGDVSLNCGGTVSATTANFVINGNLRVEGGSISVPGGDVSAGTVSLSEHRHIETQPGEGQSGTPFKPSA